MLNVRELTKTFEGLNAVSDLTFDLDDGEILGLIGPNGAGKTSFFNALTGIHPPDAGEFLLDGAPLPTTRPQAVVARGIARTFQNIRLFRELSVLENVMAARHRHTRAGLWSVLAGTRASCAEERACAEEAHALLEYVGIDRLAGSLAHSLSYGDQRRLEIARALATAPRLLALDEPAAGMNATETAALGELIHRIRADGVTVLLIEHDVNLVMGLCDRVAVLDFGRKIAEDVPAAVQRDQAVIDAYLGGGRHAA